MVPTLKKGKTMKDLINIVLEDLEKTKFINRIIYKHYTY